LQLLEPADLPVDQLAQLLGAVLAPARAFEVDPRDLLADVARRIVWCFAAGGERGRRQRRAGGHPFVNV
jgi:hypothetical protein